MYIFFFLNYFIAAISFIIIIIVEMALTIQQKSESIVMYLLCYAFVPLTQQFHTKSYVYISQPKEQHALKFRTNGKVHQR